MMIVVAVMMMMMVTNMAERNPEHSATCFRSSTVERVTICWVAVLMQLLQRQHHVLTRRLLPMLLLMLMVLVLVSMMTM